MSLEAAIYNEARLARKFSEVVGSRRQLILRRVVTSSEVLTLPAGHYDIIAVGAGGSGGAGYGTLRTTGCGGPAWARDWGIPGRANAHHYHCRRTGHGGNRKHCRC